MYVVRRIGMTEAEDIKELFTKVFTIEPWNDDWSDCEQLDLYISDLVGQKNSLTFGLFQDEQLVGLSMGRIKHWYTGTEYCVDELCVKTDLQRNGLGTYFISEIEKEITKLGLKHIFLLTDNNVPAYGFYLKNGFCELKTNVAFAKKI